MDLKQFNRERLQARLEERRAAVRKHAEFLTELDNRVSLLEEDPLYGELVGRVLELEAAILRYRASTATLWRRLKLLLRGPDAS